MRAVAYRFRAEVRERRRRWLGLALVVGFASGTVLALAAGARRTDSSYDRLLREQRAYDVMVLNYPEDGSATFDFDELAGLPEVADSAVAHFEYLAYDAGTLTSADGRIGTEMNAFKVLEGRGPDPADPTEIVVGFVLAEAEGLQVGDTVDLLTPEMLAFVLDPAGAPNPFPDFEPSEEELDEMRRVVTEVVPDGRLEIVGIVASPGDFPPQFHNNRVLVHASPALYPHVADGQHEALMVRLRPGGSSVEDFLSQLERRSDGQPIQVQVQREHAEAVNRSIRFQAVALRLLAGCTALVAALALGQLLARLAQVERDEREVLGALGLTPRELLGLGGLRSLGIAAVGTFAGVALALLASPVFPLGLARTAEPDEGSRADLAVLLVGGAATIVVLTVLGVCAAWLVDRRERATAAAGTTPPGTGARLLGDSRVPLSWTIGARWALSRGPVDRPVPIRTTYSGLAIGIATLVAAVTFGASLSHLLDEPGLYGRIWDAELVSFDAPESQARVTAAGADLLADDDRVEAMARGTASLGLALGVGGVRVDALALEPLKGEMELPILEGRAPQRVDEVAFGARTLRSLGASVGDSVDVRLPGVESGLRMRIVGSAVFPSTSERAQLGDGALLTIDAALALEPGDVLDEASLLLRLAPGADLDAVVDDIREASGEAIYVFESVDPTDIVNFGRVEGMPAALGAVLGVMAVAVLAHVLLSTVGQRRRELGVLKTLGFVRRQVALSIASQATAVATIGMVVAVPVGIALGRWSWTLMAEDLGVAAAPRVPMAELTGAVVMFVALANLIALLPARHAARTSPAAVLRAE